MKVAECVITLNPDELDTAIASYIRKVYGVALLSRLRHNFTATNRDVSFHIVAPAPRTKDAS